MVRVYLGGPSAELARVRKYAAALEGSGIVTLTARWWECVEANGVGNDHRLTREQQAEYALGDLEGVRSAQVAWFLWPSQRHSEGVPAELGFALGLGSRGPRVFVTGERASHCIFTALAPFRDASDDVGLCEVIRIARMWQSIAEVV